MFQSPPTSDPLLNNAQRVAEMPPACVGDARSSCEGSMGVQQPPAGIGGTASLQGFVTPKHVENQNDCLRDGISATGVDRHP